VSSNDLPHSIGVRPLLNMSGDASQEYFADGITKELLNSLTHISELQVSARTSSFAFKGRDVKIGTTKDSPRLASAVHIIGPRHEAGATANGRCCAHADEIFRATLPATV
jgi:hypothetical protein